VRKGLRKRGFEGHFTAVYSDEKLPLREGIPSGCGTGQCLCPARDKADPSSPIEWCSNKKVINGSAVTVTAAAGMVLASLVIRDIYARYASGSKVS
jgi:tRNA A37 threonylcarbamoyladenosine dehydratase